MKKIRLLIPTILCLVIVLNLTSCFLITTKDAGRHDNGNHNGWYKNPNKTNKTIIIVPNGQGNKGHENNGNGKGHDKH